MGRDYKSEMDYWIDAWDELKNDLPASVKSSPVVLKDDDYYNNYLGSLKEEEESVIHEEKIANPVYPDSITKDQDKPKPSWVKEDLLKEVEELKNKLFDLENKLARLGQGKSPPKKPVSDKQEDLMKEIEAIRLKIDKVCNRLGLEDEPPISMRNI